ncbi:hypothetical protein RFI_07884 [Reticulomyxa filosa]|uniref:Uncharacterized protein n=1 Tax=Reticulomyxa filosa TaxID=46433 RepID=X6NTX2_RETFI|nr:hypothetical protein RFI_07884 [Reticulomyxa filosa]|eukprot:ETO29239.1 hypothetical protein RFI_07884 [Reticulomyxa filosa]
MSIFSEERTAKTRKALLKDCPRTKNMSPNQTQHKLSQKVAMNNIYLKLQQREYPCTNLNTSQDRYVRTVEFHNYNLKAFANIFEKIHLSELDLQRFQQPRPEIIELFCAEDVIILLTRNGLGVAFERKKEKRQQPINYKKTSNFDWVNLQKKKKINKMMCGMFGWQRKFGSIVLFEHGSASTLQSSLSQQASWSYFDKIFLRVFISFFILLFFVFLPVYHVINRHVRKRKPQLAKRILSQERILHPGFVEFDDNNAKILTYNANDKLQIFSFPHICQFLFSSFAVVPVSWSCSFRFYRIWNCKDHSLACQIPNNDGKIQEVKIRWNWQMQTTAKFFLNYFFYSFLVLLYKRLKTKTEFFLYCNESYRVVHIPIQSQVKCDFIELFGDKLLLGQKGKKLVVFDMSQDKIVRECKNFVIPEAFLHITDSSKLLLVKSGKLFVLDFMTDSVLQFRISLVETTSEYSRHASVGLFVSSNQDTLATYCRQKIGTKHIGNACIFFVLSNATLQISQKLGSVNLNCLSTGKLLGSIQCPIDDTRVSCSPISEKKFKNQMSPPNPLGSVCGVFYNEIMNEIYTGNTNGFIHVWGVAPDTSEDYLVNNKSHGSYAPYQPESSEDEWIFPYEMESTKDTQKQIDVDNKENQQFFSQ